MSRNKDISRKTFLKKLSWLIALPYLLFAVLMVRKNHKVSATKEIRIKVPSSEGIWFFGEVIVVSSKGKITAYASRCTHLGCRINTVEDGKLVCPCHGSTFDDAGSVIKGPATKGLEVVPYKLDKETNELIVKV